MKVKSFITGYLRRHILVLIFVIFFLLLIAITQLVIPLIIRNIIGHINNLRSSGDMLQTIKELTLTVVIVYFLRAFLKSAFTYTSHRLGYGIVSKVRCDAYDHIQRLKTSYFDESRTGNLMSIIVNDTGSIELLIAHALPDIAVNLFLAIGSLIFMGVISGRLMLISIIPMPLFLVVVKIYNEKTLNQQRKYANTVGKLHSILNDNISGIKEIKNYCREDEEGTKVGENVYCLHGVIMRWTQLMAIFTPLIELIAAISNILLIFFGGIFVVKGVIFIEDFVAYLLFVNTLYQSLEPIGRFLEQAQQSVAGIERVIGVFNEQPEILRNHPSEIRKIDGDLVFKDVCFSYKKDEWILKDVSLTIRANTSTAIVGRSGVGKTTLVNLLPRFYQATQGSITMAGVDINQYSLGELRKQISFVFQDGFLFYGTVYENIAIAAPNATKDEIIRAAQIANAQGFIDELPDRYQTMIGERGVRLSGGQKQRISLARAVLKDAPILILDEATSSVDSDTEFNIYHSIKEVMGNRTIIIITHDLRTVKDCDTIVVLDDNTVSEMGNHEELMKANGIYNMLFESRVLI